MSKTLLVVGASGQLGRRVAVLAAAHGWHVVGTYHSRPLVGAHLHAYPLDILDRESVLRLVRAKQPHAVVNTAFRLSGPRFWEVNAEGAAVVAAAAVAAGARLVHISTDAIFDGRGAPYSEQDVPCPITSYGASKAAAETAVRALAPEAALVRTSLIIDDDPRDNHSEMALDIAAGRRPEALFTDEIRCPVAAVDLAAAIIELLDLPWAGPLNVAGADALSRYELGVLVAHRYGIDPARIRSASLATSGLHRPPDLRLDLTRARSILHTRMRGIREVLAREDV